MIFILFFFCYLNFLHTFFSIFFWLGQVVGQEFFFFYNAVLFVWSSVACLSLFVGVCILCLFWSVPKHLAIHPTAPAAAADAVALPSSISFSVFCVPQTHLYRLYALSVSCRDIGALGRDYGRLDGSFRIRAAQRAESGNVHFLLLSCCEEETSDCQHQHRSQCWLDESGRQL